MCIRDRCSMKESSEKQYTVLNNKFDEMKSGNEVKFNVLSSGVNELKEQNNEVNIKLNEQKIKCESSFNERCV